MINQLSHKSRSRINLTLFIILFSFGACTNVTQSEWHASQDVSATKWSSTDSLKFIIPGQDSLSRYDMTINVRHDDSYPYQNLGLEISMLKGDTLIICDTTEIFLTKPEGRWNGTGWGSLYSSATTYGTIFFPFRGNYQVIIRPCMNDRELNGIYSVGFDLRKK